MALSATEKIDLSTQYQRDSRCPGAVSKADLAAAITAVDAWIDANAASLNTALPTAFKNAATASQKAELLMYCLEKRYGRV